MRQFKNGGKNAFRRKGDQETGSPKSDGLEVSSQCTEDSSRSKIAFRQLLPQFTPGAKSEGNRGGKKVRIREKRVDVERNFGQGGKIDSGRN